LLSLPLFCPVVYEVTTPQPPFIKGDYAKPEDTEKREKTL